jgi:hypothetical protein
MKKDYSFDAVVLAGKSKLGIDGNNEFYSPLHLSDSFPHYLFHTKMTISPEIKDSIPIDYKSIVPVNGRPIVNYVMQALAESGYIKKIYVVGEKYRLNNIDFDKGKEKINFVDDKGSLLDNLIEGGNKTNTQKILYSTSDIPLITIQDINEFILKCYNRDEGHFYLSYYLKEDYEKNFLGSKSGKFYQLKEKFVKNAGIFMLDREFLNEINKNNEFQGVISSLYSQRKSFLNLLGMLIKKNLFEIVSKYLSKDLTIEQAEKILYNKMKYRFYGVESSSRTGVDVDSLSEAKEIEKILKKENKS